MDIATVNQRQQAAWAAGGAPRQRAHAEGLEAVRRFDVSDDATLVLRMDYLQAVLHKPATP